MVLSILLLLEVVLNLDRAWIVNSERNPTGRQARKVTRPSLKETTLILSVTMEKHCSSANICNQPRLKYLFCYQGITVTGMQIQTNMDNVSSGELCCGCAGKCCVDLI